MGLAAVVMAGEGKVEVGKAAPNFTLPNQDDQNVSLKDLSGKWAVVYFYPKDDTPGCTIQACDFTDSIKAFEGLSATVVGVSPDSTASHRDFIKKHNLKITLLSDPKKKMMSDYEAIAEGRVVRSTVLIDPQGKVAHHWPKVNAKGHAAEVQKKLQELQGKG